MYSSGEMSGIFGKSYILSGGYLTSVVRHLPEDGVVYSCPQIEFANYHTDMSQIRSSGGYLTTVVHYMQRLRVSAIN